MEFKEKLKELRKKRGVSQQTLADAVLVSRSTVAKWETGLSLPNDKSLELLSAYFGVEQSELISDGETQEVLVEKNKSLSKQRKIIIALGTVFGACAAAWIIICIIGIIAMSQKPSSNPPGQSFYGIVEYSETYGYNVNIPEYGLCEIPCLADDCYEYAENYIPAEGDLIYIHFSYSNCPVSVEEIYPARFVSKAWDISLMRSGVSLRKTGVGYLFECETDDVLSEFAEGDTVCLYESDGYNGVVRVSVFCFAEVRKAGDGRITLFLPSDIDEAHFLAELANGGFTYGSADIGN